MAHFWVLFLSFFFSFFFGAWSFGHPSPTWLNVTPLGLTLPPPPCLISFFTSIRYLCIGYYHSMHRKIEFTPECHPTFESGHNNGFWPFWAIFFCFCQVWGGDALLLCCSQTPRHKTAFMLGTEIVIYIFICSRIAHWRSLSATKMGFCHFLVIFCSLGVHSQPPRAQQFLLSPESHSHPTSE